MPEQSILEVFGTERFPQKRIVAQVNHACAKIVAGTPIRVDIVQLVGCERLPG
jgi:hypothetical protein